MQQSNKNFNIQLSNSAILYNNQTNRNEVKQFYNQDQSLANRTDQVIAKCKIVDRVKKLPVSTLVYFQSDVDQELYIVKVFSSIRDYINEVKILNLFNNNPVLAKYIPYFDSDTFKNQAGVIYPKYVPVHDLIELYDHMLVKKLLKWNRELLKDVHSQELTICDHKLDNILYDPVKQVFYITDLEGVKQNNQECEIVTFNLPSINWTNSYIFDYIHFLSSFQYLFGIEKYVYREYQLLAQELIQTLPISQSVDQITSLLEIIGLLKIKTTDYDIKQLIQRGTAPQLTEPIVLTAQQIFPNINVQYLQKLLNSCKQQVTDKAERYPYFKSIPVDQQQILINDQVRIYSICLALMCKKGKVSPVNILDLIENVFKYMDIRKPINDSIQMKPIQGSGSNSNTNLYLLLILILLIFLYFNQQELLDSVCQETDQRLQILNK